MSVIQGDTATRTSTTNSTQNTQQSRRRDEGRDAGGESTRVQNYGNAGNLQADPTRQRSDPQASRPVTRNQANAAQQATGQPARPYRPDGDVRTLRNAMEGLGTDEAAIHNVLKGKSAAERQALQRAYREQTGRELRDDMRSEMSGEDLRRAESYLNQGRQTDADRLYEAMRGAGTDEATVMRMLEGKTPQEVQALRDEYRQKYNQDLGQDIRSELSGSDQRRAEILLQGQPTENPAIADPAARQADRLQRTGQQSAELLDNAMRGMGTDERAILDTLHGKTPEERQAIQDAYRQRTGRELQADLNSELSGSDRSLANSYLQSGRESSADALHRAVDGMGTDETLIMRTLEGKTPEERQAIIREYEQKHGESLRGRLESELSGEDRVRALALLDRGEMTRRDDALAAMAGAGTNEAALFDALQNATPEERRAMQNDPEFQRRLEGDLSGSDLTRARELLQNGRLDTRGKLNVAMDGMGTDEGAIFRALEDATPEERRALQDDPQFRERLNSELSGDDLTRANRLLQDGREPARDTLRHATSGAGTDEAAVFRALERATPEEREEMKNDPQVRQLLQQELSGADLRRAELLLENGTLTARQKVEIAGQGAGTDEAAIFDALQNATPEERAQMAQDPEFRRQLESELGGADLTRANTLLERGETTPSEDLRWAMDGAGTNESMIMDTLGRLETDEQRTQLLNDYRERYGRDLLADLESDLSSSDYRRAEGMLRTAARSPQEAMDRVHDDMIRDREGGGWTAVSSAFVDTFSDRGRDMDQTAREVRGTFHDARHNGTLDAPETLETMRGLESRLQVQREDYAAARQEIADHVTTGVSIVAATVIAGVTLGTGTPISAALLASSALGVGGGKVIANKAVMGNDYDIFGADGARDFAVGAAEGAAMPAGTAAGRALWNARTVAGSTFRGAISGGTSGFASGTARSATDEATWENGFVDGLGRVATKAGVETVVGATVGAVIDGTWGASVEGPVRGAREGWSQALEEGVEVGAVRRAGRGAVDLLGTINDPVKKAATGVPKDESKHVVKDEERTRGDMAQ